MTKTPALSRLAALFLAAGPGLLMAGAAIGVSHLVQSTRAGADFGFQLISVVLLINLLKYPFFEYGHRYTIATGNNLLDGYKELGSGFLWAFLSLAIVSAVGSTAGVTFVTAGLAQHLFGTALDPTLWSVAIMGGCVAILAVGRYRALDAAMKLIMAVLAATTVVACAAAVHRGSVAPSGHVGPSPWSAAAVPFVIALMGWMPAPIEISVFQSLWIQARDRATGRRMTVTESRFDFNFGYGLTAFMAVLFVVMGALVMHGSGLTFRDSSGAFATQLIDVYRHVLGPWAGPVIALAAFTTMFSTTITVIDGYPRALAEGTHLVAPRLGAPNRLYDVWIVLVCAPAILLIVASASSLTGLIDLVTTTAFLSAPVYGYLNYRLITSDHVPPGLRPGMPLRVLSWLGLIFFVGFSLVFLVVRFAPDWRP